MVVKLPLGLYGLKPEAAFFVITIGGSFIGIKIGGNLTEIRELGGSLIGIRTSSRCLRLELGPGVLRLELEGV